MNAKQKGIFYIVMSAFFFALMNVFVRLSGDVPSIQKSFFRNLVAIGFAAFVLFRSRSGFHIQKSSLKELFLRSLFGTLGVLCNFYAVDHLMLADASMLNKLSPFFAIIFSFFLLKERLKPFQIISVITAFIGSLFIIRPDFGNFNSFPALIGMTGGLCAGIAYTFVRILGLKGEKGPVIVLFFSMFSCISVLPWVLTHYSPMTVKQLLLLLAAGLSAAGGQFSITAAYCHAPAKEISVFDYSQILFSAILGFFIFGQVPDLFSWIGYGIICGTAIFVYVKNTKAGPV